SQILRLERRIEGVAEQGDVAPVADDLAGPAACPEAIAAPARQRAVRAEAEQLLGGEPDTGQPARQVQERCRQRRRRRVARQVSDQLLLRLEAVLHPVMVEEL